MFRSIKHQSARSRLRMPVGVGLRHPHFNDVLSGENSIDFVEVHSENFFAEGGLAVKYLEHISERYPLSFHGTSMGLGSVEGPGLSYLKQLKRVIERFKPSLVSDHASFAWSTSSGQLIHMGDLLPIPFSQQSLDVLANNVDRVQQFLGRQLLVENLVVYVDIFAHRMSETEFLSMLVERTGCGLLVDLNNLLVNERNRQSRTALENAKRYLRDLPADAVKEVHLAGYTPPHAGDLIIDDHSQPVSDECWQLYQYSLLQFNSFASLVEWDNKLPAWQVLLNESEKASRLISEHQIHLEARDEQRYAVSA